LEDFAVVDLSNDGGFSDNNEVFINLHLYDTVDGFNGSFFYESVGVCFWDFFAILVGKLTLLVVRYI
jgi:hypothetical protein